MTTARDVMTPSAEHCSDDATAAEAARKLSQADIGAVPVCGPDGKLCGVITDRDLATQVVAEGRDPQQVTLRELLDGHEVVTIGADDSMEEAIRTMKDHAVRRLPVIDGTELVGMLSQADIARALPDTRVGDLVGAISAAPPNG
ncbi:MAG: CBS domain-containing protein [Acidimicrobiia bacterium]|jgi:CBS domain-containing protein